MRLADRLPHVLDAERDQRRARPRPSARAPNRATPPLLHRRARRTRGSADERSRQGNRGDEGAGLDAARRFRAGRRSMIAKGASRRSSSSSKGRRQGLDREARPRERKRLPRRPQTERPGLAVRPCQGAFLGAGPGGPVLPASAVPFRTKRSKSPRWEKLTDARHGGLAGAPRLRQQRRCEAPITGAVPAFFERRSELRAISSQQRQMQVTRRRVDNRRGRRAGRRSIQK